MSEFEKRQKIRGAIGIMRSIRARLDAAFKRAEKRMADQEKDAA